MISLPIATRQLNLLNHIPKEYHSQDDKRWRFFSKIYCWLTRIERVQKRINYILYVWCFKFWVINERRTKKINYRTFSIDPSLNWNLTINLMLWHFLLWCLLKPLTYSLLATYKIINFHFLQFLQNQNTFFFFSPNALIAFLYCQVI